MIALGLALLVAGAQAQDTDPDAPSCQAGDLQACVRAADRLRATDPAAAFAAYRLACDAGLPSACGAVGRMSIEGEGVPVNVGEGIYALELACRGGEASSCTRLGGMFTSGALVAKDISRADGYFDLACEAGDVATCLMLGDLYAPGSASASPARARRYYELACQAGDEGACRKAHAVPVVGVDLPVDVPVDEDASAVAGVVGLAFQAGFVADPEALSGTTRTYGAGMRVAFAGFEKGEGAAAFDVALGVAAGGGFVYGLDLLLGPGRFFGDRFALALVGGIGTSGIVNHVPIAFQLPVEAVGFVYVGRSLAIETYARLDWNVATKPSRRGGSDTVPFADELSLGASLYTGRRLPGSSDETGSGVWLGGVYRELMGTRVLQISFGFGGASDPW